MAGDTHTTYYNFTKPEPQKAATTWGTSLNANMDSIDSLVHTNQTAINTLQGQVQPNAVIISRTTAAPTVPASLWFYNATVPAAQQPRWIMFQTNEAESGGAAGSNLIIQNYSDAGTALGTVVEFIRASGNVSFAKAVSVTGTLGVTGAFTAAAGATITGTLSVNGNIQGNVHYFGWPTMNDFLANQTTDLRYIQWAANWYDGWTPSTGVRSWVGGSSTLMSLDTAGNLITAGGVTAGGNISGGNITASGTVSGAAISTSGAIGATGNITSNGTIGAAVNVTGVGVYGLGGNVVTKASGSGNATFQMQDNTGAVRGYCYWNSTINSVVLNSPVFANSFELPTSGDCYANPGSSAHNFVVTVGNALKPGGGSWLSSSDARIKTVTGDYAAGLDAVLQLRPVTYTYRGDYAKSGGGKQFVGLVADEAMKALPEMVSLQKGTIDGHEVDDLKVLDTTGLIFALVNCVKELKAEIEALKAAR